MVWCSFALIFLRICLFSTSAVSGSSDTIAREFRYDYSYEETTNAFYKLNRVRVPWYNAVTWCQEEGAELAFPTSDHEAQIITNYFSRATATVWLPFHDQYSEGVFISTNGTSLTKLYTNWLMEEPNDGGATGEDCVSMNREGYYKDVPCTEKYMFICKINKDITFKNSECLTNVPGYKLSSVTGHCYKIHPESKTWHAAFRICEAEMAGLVELNSQAEVSYLVQELKAYPDSVIIGVYSYHNLVHIDANELLSVNNYVTRTGKTIRQAGYDKWFQGQPDKGDQHCGCMGKEGGMLYDLNCELNHAMFVCEKESVLSNVGQWKNK